MNNFVIGGEEDAVAASWAGKINVSGVQSIGAVNKQRLKVTGWDWNK